MVLMKETSRGRADDAADFRPPAWHVGDDGSRCVVLELQDCPVGSTTGISLAQISCRADFADELGRILAAGGVATLK